MNIMGTSNKQIGWSQEASLLWEIIKQLDELIKLSSMSLTTTTTTTAAP